MIARRTKHWAPLQILVLGIAWFGTICCSKNVHAEKLPAPNLEGTIPLEQAIAKRRSNRKLAKTKLPRKLVGQLLWAAQGITDRKQGLRAAPSAGALYPIEIFVFLPDGSYQYEPQPHALKAVHKNDLRNTVSKQLYGGAWVADAPVLFLVTAVYERTATKYGDRAKRYAQIEVGHATQNLLLQATALGLHGVSIGAVNDKGMKRALPLPANHEPLYVIPIGYPATN